MYMKFEREHKLSSVHSFLSNKSRFDCVDISIHCSFLFLFLFSSNPHVSQGYYTMRGCATFSYVALISSILAATHNNNKY